MYFEYNYWLCNLHIHLTELHILYESNGTHFLEDSYFQHFHECKREQAASLLAFFVVMKNLCWLSHWHASYGPKNHAVSLFSFSRCHEDQLLKAVLILTAISAIFLGSTIILAIMLCRRKRIPCKGTSAAILEAPQGIGFFL